MARGDDLVLKISADTTAVASGLKPMTQALAGIEDVAEDAEKSLKAVTDMRVSPHVDTSDMDKLQREIDQTEDDLRELSRTEVTIDLREQAIRKAREDIERLKDEIAENVILGVDTRAAQRELASLQSSVKKLTATPAVFEVDVEAEGMEKATSGMEGLREGSRETASSLGELSHGFTGVTLVAGAALEAVSDLNEMLQENALRAREAGVNQGRMTRAVGATTSFLSGPWGLAVAAGTILLGQFAQSQDEAEQATEALSQSIDFQTGAMERSNRQTAAQMLDNEDMQLNLLKFAEANKISTQDMVSALLGEEDALARVNAGFDRVASQHKQLAPFVENLRKQFDGLRSTNETSAETQRRVGAAVGNATDEIADQGDVVADQRDGWERYEDAVDDARKALDDMIGSLDIFNGRFADAEEAQAKYLDGAADLNEALKENKRTLNENSEAGRDNAKLVREQAKNLDDLTRARLRDAERSGESTDEILADYDKQRKDLEKTAGKLAGNTKVGKDYVDTLLATPDSITSDVTLTGVQSAEDHLDDLTKQRTAVVNVELHANVNKFLNELRRRGIDPDDFGPTSGGGTRPGPQTAAAPSTVFMTPRIFLDSRPIRAALRGDIETTVSNTVATTRRRGRL